MANHHAAQHDDRALGLLETLGSGFLACMGGDDDGGMFSVLSEACQLTASIDQYHREVGLRLPLHVLAVKAIAFQHRLLTLSPCLSDRVDLSPCSADAIVYQAIRFTTLIYSDFMIFPSAEVRQGRSRLASCLRECLLQWFDARGAMLDGQNVYQDLLLWCLVLGGVASSNTSHRSWYVKQVAEQLLARTMTWGMLETTLYRFLYWDYVFTSSVTNLWMEARSLGTHEGLEQVHCMAEMDLCEPTTFDIGGVRSLKGALSEVRVIHR